MKSKFKKMLYGGDYNPEQWPREIWKKDMELFDMAGINSATVNVFSWAKIQPSEEIYDFSELDDIVDMLTKEGKQIVLATSTAALPAWMVKRYPEVSRTDYEGRHHKFGQRHNACPNSPVYQHYARELASRLAQRYGQNENVVCWHVNNEYGGECYCENCEKAFRVWLRKKYKTIDALNKAWNLAFWGHTIYDWDEVVLPNALSEGLEGDKTAFAGISIDYMRFNSDSILNNFKMERDAIRQYDKDTPITTNLMGTFKGLDYFKWAKEMDIVSWDNYPGYDTPWGMTALRHDLMRGLKDEPFMLMEQTPSQQNWQPFNALKRPGVMRLWSYQAVAHGSDAVLFFQMKRSIGSCEKYHGAVISHAGHEHTRVFREVAELGRELEQIGSEIIGSGISAQTALMFDWENWWAVEYSAGPSVNLKYKEQVLHYYTALHRQNIPVDIIGEEDDLSGYKLVIAPLLYMTKPGVDERIREFVKAGGTFVTTCFSGYVDENDRVITGGYPGKLRDILGVWVEESDALPEHKSNRFICENQEYPAEILCDIIHPEGAETLAEYQEDFYAGTPVLTENSFGKGKAYYVGTCSGDEFYRDFTRRLCREQQIVPSAEVMEEVEAVRRRGEQAEYLFLLNHGDREQEISIPEQCLELTQGKEYRQGERVFLPAKGVMILRFRR